MISQTKALLLRRYRFSETSLVIVWLSQEYGKVKTTARGAMKSGGNLIGRLELFTQSEIVFTLSKKKELHSLNEVLPSPSWNPLPTCYHTLLAASYFSELCDLVLEPLHPAPEIFDLLQRAFLFLQKQEPNHRAVEHFEKELAKALGIYDPSQSAFASLQVLLQRPPRSREELLKKLS
jgi:DNA repair protein RecO (recombination protein O)